MKTRPFFFKEVPVGKIEIDFDSRSSDSPEVQQRMDRITENYAKLDDVLQELEVRISNDPTLKEFDDMLAAEDVQPDEAAPKKRYRKKGAKKKSTRRKSAGPNKPR